MRCIFVICTRSKRRFIHDSYFGKLMILILAQQLCKFSVSTPNTKVNLIGRIQNKIVFMTIGFTNISWPLTTRANQQLTNYIQTDSTAVTLHALKKTSNIKLVSSITQIYILNCWDKLFTPCTCLHDICCNVRCK